MDIKGKGRYALHGQVFFFGEGQHDGLFLPEFGICSALTNIAAGCFTANLSTLLGLAYPVQQPICLPYLTLQIQYSISGRIAEEEDEEVEILYLFRPDNTSDHMQQGLMTCITSSVCNNNVCLWTP